MSLKTNHISEILQIGHRKFRVPKLYNSKDIKEKNNKLAEDYLKEAEENWSSDYPSSDSDDDELFAYWLNDEEKIEEQAPKEAEKTVKVSQPIGNYNQEKEFQELGEKKEEIIKEKIPKEQKKNHTHYLHFPLYKCDKFVKRYDNWKKSVLKTSAKFEEFFLEKEELRYNIIPLNLSEFQLDILSQILQNFTQAHPECKINFKSKNQSKQKGPKSIRLDVTNIDFKSQNDDEKSCNLIFTRPKKSGDLEKLESIVHSLISKLIEIGIVNDNSLEGARFDLSTLSYQLENPDIELMKSKVQGGVFQCGQLLKDFGNFNFGYVDVDSFVLSEVGGKEVIEVNLK